MFKLFVGGLTRVSKNVVGDEVISGKGKKAFRGWGSGMVELAVIVG